MTLQVTELPFITKVIVPKRRGYKVRRHHLIEAIKARVNKKVQVICAPAGYGKTSLLAEFVNEVQPPACWYSFAPEDSNPSIFLRYCLQAVREKVPGFGEGYVNLAQASHQADWRTHLGFFINALHSDIGGRLIFAFDDVHWVHGKEELTEAVSLLIERAPANIHFGLGARTWPSLPCLPKLAADDELSSIGVSDLRFSLEETAELLSSLWDREITPGEAQEITSRTRGWPTAIMLTARNEPSKSIPELVGSGDQGILFDYLSQEIFNNLPQPLKSFLLRSSILREFTASQCSTLFGVGDAQAMIDQVKELGHFLDERTGNGSAYAYHDLFREFLERRFQSEFPEEYQRVHHRAGALFADLGDHESAVYHFLESGDSREAIEAVKTVAESYFAQGHWQRLESLLDRLPHDKVETDPELLLLSGQLLIRLGNPTESLAQLDKVTNGSQSSGPDLVGKALVAKSTAYRRLGHLELAVSSAEEGLSLLRETNSSKEHIAEAYKQLGDAFITQGDYDRAKEHLHAGLELTNRANLRLYSLICNDLGVTYMELGDLDQAAMYLEQSKSGLLKLGSEGLLAETLNNLALVYYHKGEFDLALEEVRQAVTAASAANYPRVLATGLMNQAIVQRALGAFDDSLHSASSAMDLSRQILDQRLIAESTNALGNAYRKLGETSKAEVLLKQALLEVENSGQKYIIAVYNISLGKVYCQIGAYDQALDHLLLAETQLAELNSFRRIAEAKLYQAAVLYRTGKVEEALSSLAQAADLLPKESLDGYVLADGGDLLDVLRFAAAKRVGGRAFVRLVARLGGPSQPTQELDNLVERNRLAYRKSKSSNRFPTLRACAFGRPKVFLDTHEVTSSEWRSKKAKELFFYLLSKKQRVSNEQIVESLWPELSFSISASTLKTSVYRLRHALFNDCIVAQGSTYCINAEVPIEFDMENFQNSLNLAAGRVSNEEQEEHLSRAVSLYEGPFLSEFYSEWCDELRSDLEIKYHSALMNLASYNRSRGYFRQAIDLLEKVIDSDPYNEEAQYQYIQTYIDTNDLFSALQQLRKYARISVEELGTDLPARFLECHRRILRLMPDTA
jgi:LuxR family maltose regulon positive regulatory protein